MGIHYFVFTFNISTVNSPSSSSPNANAAYVNVSADNKRIGSSKAYTADGSDDNRNIKTNASADAYAYEDCIPFDEIKMLDESLDDKDKKRNESQGGPGDRSSYFQLEKDDNKESDICENGSRDYDRLDSTTKPVSYHQNGDEGAYQHIQPQTTPVGIDQDYQHLKRDGFR